MHGYKAGLSSHQELGMGVSRGNLCRAAELGVGVLLCLTALGCGSPTSATPTAHPTSGPPRATATPVTSTDPDDPTLLPVPANIPFLQAAAPIQNEWRQYFATGAITIVPNSTVPFQRPVTPQVVNDTNGAVDTATAQRWADAVMRETAWENWAITANQISLLDSGVISAPAVTAGVTLPTGATGFTITGSRWPSSLRLVSVRSAAQSLLRVADVYAFVATFATGWSVMATFPNGQAQPLSGQAVSAGAVDAVTGSLKSVTNFGELWFGSQGFACDSGEPPVILSLCNE